MAVNVFVPKFHTDEILNEIKICLEKGWTGLGFKTVEFENAWKEYSKLKNAHFINSSTAGLHLAVSLFKRKYGWNDGDEIIATPLTFVSSNHAILYERLKPVFADIDEYLCLDPEDIEQKITEKTKAVMYVGMGGNTGKLDEVVNLCKKYNLKLILDAAHMAGTTYKGKHIGNNADVVIFSFQAVKNLPTADSGMICFKDDELDKEVRQATWLGISKDTYARFNTSERSYNWEYNVPELGYKYHGNSVIASIGLVQLKYLDEDNAQRRAIAEKYTQALTGNDNIELIPIHPECVPSRHLYQISVENRNHVMDCFYKSDIFPGVHYNINTKYPMYEYGWGTCPKAEAYSDSLISLPLHLNLSEDDINHVIDTLKNAL